MWLSLHHAAFATHQDTKDHMHVHLSCTGSLHLNVKALQPAYLKHGVNWLRCFCKQ